MVLMRDLYESNPGYNGADVTQTGCYGDDVYGKGDQDEDAVSEQ